MALMVISIPFYIEVTGGLFFFRNDPLLKFNYTFCMDHPYKGAGVFLCGRRPYKKSRCRYNCWQDQGLGNILSVKYYTIGSSRGPYVAFSDFYTVFINSGSCPAGQ
jgi:hypothetical protein